MPEPRRKALPHDIPLWIDPHREVYFITINCRIRGCNQLATPDMSQGIFETVSFRQCSRQWWPHLFLIMPDHIHSLMTFPRSDESIKSIITNWKEWTAKRLRIHWQRDFFEHRLRSDESRREKADYIMHNPVRDGLVKHPEDWPYVYFASGAHPNFKD